MVVEQNVFLFKSPEKGAEIVIIKHTLDMLAKKKTYT